MFLTTCLRFSMIQRLLSVAYWVCLLWLVGGGGDSVRTICFICGIFYFYRSTCVHSMCGGRFARILIYLFLALSCFICISVMSCSYQFLSIFIYLYFLFLFFCTCLFHFPFGIYPDYMIYL